MEEAKKKKIFWLVVIILVIIGVLFFFLIIRDKNTTNNQIQQGNETVPEFKAPSANVEFDPEAIPKKTATEFSVENLSRNYVERFGSWSTDNQLHNLEELIPLSSAQMRVYLNSVEADYGNNDFKGVTTKSLSVKILSMDDDSAQVMVGTQRIETDKDLQENVYFQDAKVSVIKSGTTWLVDGIDWQ